MRLEMTDSAAVLLPYLTSHPHLVQMLQDKNIFRETNIKNQDTEQISINRKTIKSETKLQSTVKQSYQTKLKYLV